MQKVCVFDPTIGSPNIGDRVIMRAIDEYLDEMMPEALRINIGTHDYMSAPSRRTMRNCELCIVGGSNLLKSRMFLNAQWKLRVLDPLRSWKAVLFGCGWRNYQRKPELLTRVMMRSMLSKRWLHSVRDEYTRQQLLVAGVPNVLNTACPSMWRLTPELCARIPPTRAETAVFTLTAFDKDPVRDLAMVQAVQRGYRKVFFFCQQPEDLEYLASLDTGPAQLIPPSLHAYGDFLHEQHVDYIGTRLHGGIFALWYARRALIIGIDNRALEITRDTGLPVLKRQDIDRLADWINGARPTSIRLPEAAIGKWMGQFQAERWPAA